MQELLPNLRLKLRVCSKKIINLYDISSIEEHIKTVNNTERVLDGYVLKMSNGTYLISTEDAQEIIKILQCVN